VYFSCCFSEFSLVKVAESSPLSTHQLAFMSSII
jgi:hypothetical protein